MERYQWLAAVIAAHPEHKIFGRTRLQKTVKLLQRLGAPLDYGYTIHFYGPYSEDLQADIGLLENIGLLEEEPHYVQDNTLYYELKARDTAIKFSEDEDVEPFRNAIALMNNTDPTVLELAATYDAFREMGADHREALDRLRIKKGHKCSKVRIERALELLENIGLDAD